MAEHQRDAGGGRDREDTVALRQGRGHGLFQQDVFTGLRGSFDGRRVQVVGGGDDHGVDLWVGEQGGGVRVAATAVAGRKFRQCRRVGAHGRHQAYVVQGGDGLGVQCAKRDRHAQALAALDDVRLVAATRTNPVALAEFTARYGGRGYTDLNAVLADPAVDAVVIATPHHLHTVAVEAAAQAGKHILLEKPMAPTLAECDRILAAADQAGVTLMLGHTSQFAPAYQLAKQMLDGGELGEIVLGVSTMSKFWFEPNRRDWHLDRQTGGGMWLTAGIHCLDRLTWLVGSPVARVSARTRRPFP